MIELSRRQAIGTICAVAGVPAGCLGRKEPEPRAPFSGIVVRNFHDEPHHLEATLIRNETQVHNSSHELPRAEGRTWTEENVDGTWGDASGALEAEVTVDNGETHTDRYTDENWGCFAFGPTITTDGEYEPWHTNAKSTDESDSDCDILG
ncbi:hypothetical protein [Halostagnicola kamekurae]|uniref:Uncharacterized protein n=1 Tax=Halostagnicola kamekurae TaxID=619731 RepID=A0A1I6U9C8_9EURY|nr:hypothetical protein [Halostagnicola kamekurae]SFS98022.1 hypothetical protein SAMN04488556_3653 [Halostagnicola kamekurae]